MIEVDKLLRGFEGTDEINNFQRRVGVTRGHALKLSKKRVNLDAGKFSFANQVFDDWNRLLGGLSVGKV